MELCFHSPAQLGALCNWEKMSPIIVMTLSSNFYLMLQIGLALLGVVLIVAVVNLWLLIPTSVMFVLFYLLRVCYVSTSRSVKRLEGISKLTCFLCIGSDPVSFQANTSWYNN